MHRPRLGLYVVLLVGACGGGGGTDTTIDGNTPGLDGAATPDARPDAPPAPPCNDLPTVCAARWEATTATKFDGLLGDPTALAGFLKAVPKGGDLHNHLSGAVYAETYLDWGRIDGDCINPTSHGAVAASSCSTTNQAIPTSGAFVTAIVQAWSMQDFVAGAETGHDHFFATFGKYGIIAGGHRDQRSPMSRSALRARTRSTSRRCSTSARTPARSPRRCSAAR